MQNRLRLLMGATALLYIGPLLAGLGGYGWAIVPVFLLLFLLWLFILRPQHWPRNFHDWTRYQAWATLATNVSVQLLLVTLLFGVGRGIGGALGIKLPLGELLPISISFLSIPLARLVWDPWKHKELNDFLDDAVRLVAEPGAQDDASGLVLARRMIAPLADLPDDTAPETIAQHLLALSAHAKPAHIRTALFERVRDGDASYPEQVAMVLHATDATLAAEVPGDGPTYALNLMPKEVVLLSLYARRLAVALDLDPELWGKCPSVDLLADLAADFDNTAAEAPLRDLIEATNRAQPEDGLA